MRRTPLQAFTEQIHIDPKNFDLAELLLGQIPKKLGTAIKFSIIDTLAHVKPAIFKHIIANYDITAGSLGDQTRRAKMVITTKKPSNIPQTWGGTGGLQGLVEVNSSRFPVMRFNVIPDVVPPQKGIPVSQRQIVSVIASRASPQVGHANRFLARMPSGHLGVFWRKPGATHRRRADGQNTQQPISEEYMISPSEMLRSRKVRPALDADIHAYFEKRFVHHTRGNWIKGGSGATI